MAIIHKAVKATLDVGTADEWNDKHKVESDTSLPASGDVGELFFQESDSTLYCWDGSTWQALY